MAEIGGSQAADARCQTVEARGDGEQQLLPGIPDEITLEQIASNLPWRTFHALSTVSRAWRVATRSRKFYDARVRTNATEKLALVNFFRRDGVIKGMLYSSRENRHFTLPPITHLADERRLPRHFVPVDGRVYVLIGEHKSDGERVDVFVLDLAGQGPWKRCAAMEVTRQKSLCGTLDGKLFVFVVGSRSCYLHTRNLQVYDPTEDTWSAIKPMRFERLCQQVVTLGEEICSYSGNGAYSQLKYAHSLEAYHPGKDEWRMLEWYMRSMTDFLFVAHGKVYATDRSQIYVRDDENNSWSRVYTHAFPFPIDTPRTVGERNVNDVRYISVVALEHELLALVLRFNFFHERYSICIIRSRGFGRAQETIVWEEVNFPISSPPMVHQTFVTFYDYCMYPIEL